MRTALSVLALVFPPIAALALLIAVVAAEWSGRGWFARAEDAVTLSEAAGIPRAAVVLRMIRHGADPDRSYSVARGIVRNEVPLTISPMEAAVLRGELTIIRLLEANGATRGPELTAHLLDAARNRGADDIVAYLSR